MAASPRSIKAEGGSVELQRFNVHVDIGPDCSLPAYFAFIILPRSPEP